MLVLGGLALRLRVGSTLALRLTARTRTAASGSGMVLLESRQTVEGIVLGMPEPRTQSTNPSTPVQIVWFLLTVRMTEVKPLLARTTLVVLPVMLALATFTVMLTLVSPRVGELPMLLLAMVMTLFTRRRPLMMCSPRLGVTWVKMILFPRVLPSLLLEAPLSLMLEKM